jgi:hypothetical protein
MLSVNLTRETHFLNVFVKALQSTGVIGAYIAPFKDFANGFQRYHYIKAK